MNDKEKELKKHYSSLIKKAQKENPFAKLSDIVYHILESQILSLELEPGAKLKINTVAEYLNISGTPVREAVEALEKTGLIIGSKGDGGKYKTYTVFDIDDHEVQDLFVVRKSIESTAAYICAERNWLVDTAFLEQCLESFGELLQKYIEGGAMLEAKDSDMAFHRAIVKFTGNKFLYDMYTSLDKRLDYLSIRTCEFMAAGPNREDLRILLRQHYSVLRAIQMGFPELAREAMATHIDFCAENCIIRRHMMATEQ